MDNKNYDKILKDIQFGRDKLIRLIEKMQGDLLHPEVIKASKELDNLLTLYEKLKNIK